MLINPLTLHVSEYHLMELLRVAQNKLETLKAGSPASDRLLNAIDAFKDAQTASKRREAQAAAAPKGPAIMRSQWDVPD